MKVHTIQTSFLTGVLDPRAKARVDTDAYNSALLEGENVVVSHLGGVQRRPGLAYVDSLPGKLTPITQGTYSVPTPPADANLVDDNELSRASVVIGAPTQDPFVVVQLDLGISLDVSMVDVLSIQLDTGSTTEFCIQYSDDASTWTTLGEFFETVDYHDTRSFRRVGPVAARHWRVAKIGGTDVGTITAYVGGFRLWQDTGEVSEARVIPFEVSATERYAVVLTDRTASVYGDGVLVDTLPIPHTSDDLAGVDAATDAETMVIVHEDYKPRFAFREAEDHMQTQEVAFDSVPEFDYADTSSPDPVTCIQIAVFTGVWVRGNTFQLSLEGAKTEAITWHGDSTPDERDAQENDIARAVQKLYTVKGFTGVSCTRTALGEYTIALGEGSAGDYDLMSGNVLTGGNVGIQFMLFREGSPRSEDVWSAARGWPRTVAFHGGRMYLGGTKGREQTLFGSQVANSLEFKQDEGLEDDPIQVAIVGQQLASIEGLVSGRQFQLFTAGAEYRFYKQSTAVISPGDAPSYQTGYGAAKIRPVSIDGSTLYVQRNRKSVRDFKYNYEEDAYDSLGVSSLAPHLFNDVVDLFAWNGSRQDDLSLVFVVNGDGTVAVLNSRKEANVQAWTRWTTQGRFLAGAAVLEDIYFVVRRTVDGREVNFLEKADSGRYLDASVTATGTDLTTVSGLDHLNTVTCRVRADGFTQSDVTPTAGSVTLEEAADTVEVGLGWSVAVTPMPLNTIMPRGGSNFMRRQRVVKIRAKVYETLGLLVNGREMPDRKFDIDVFDTVAEPFSGTLAIEETTNWDEEEDKLVRFTQVDPLPFTLLGVDVALEVSE